MKRLQFSSEKILSISAVVVSIGTLVGIAYQNLLVKRQQYASVIPYVVMYNTNLIDSYSFKVDNRGVGPAFIEKVEVISGDSVYNEDLQSFLGKNNSEVVENLTSSFLTKGMVVKAGEVFPLVWVENDSVNAKKLKEILKDIDFKITYSSIYGEKWSVTRKGFIPQKIE
jgi:hypothetical protein